MLFILYVTMGFIIGALVSAAVMRFMLLRGMFNTHSTEYVMQNRPVPVPCEEMTLQENVSISVLMATDGRVVMRVNGVAIVERTTAPPSYAAGVSDEQSEEP